MPKVSLTQRSVASFRKQGIALLALASLKLTMLLTDFDEIPFPVVPTPDLLVVQELLLTSFRSHFSGSRALLKSEEGAEKVLQFYNPKRKENFTRRRESMFRVLVRLLRERSRA